MAYGTVNADVIGTSVAGSNLGAGNASIMKNRIINGAMVIDQRNAGTATANTISGYTVDRWIVNQTTTGKLIAQQNQGGITPPAGFSNYLGVTSQSSYSVGAGDWYAIQQSIEGYNVADLNFGLSTAKSCTLSFWVRSSLTGTFAGTLGNAISTREYPFSYSIPVANTWTQISILVNGDTSGSWNITNGVGLYMMCSLGMGSNFTTGTANSTWATASTISIPSGATSVVGTSGATFYITGVQLEVGSSATGFEYRQYGQELALCQRYFAKSYDIETAVGTATRSGYVNWNWQNLSNYGTVTVYLPVRMRAAPTSTNYNPDLTNTVGGRYYNGSAEVAFTGSMNGWTNYQSNIQFNKDSTNSTNMLIQWTASAEL